MNRSSVLAAITGVALIIFFFVALFAFSLRKNAVFSSASLVFSKVPVARAVLEEKRLEVVKTSPQSQLFSANDTPDYSNERGLFLGFDRNVGKIATGNGKLTRFTLSKDLIITCLPENQKNTWIDNDPDLTLNRNAVYDEDKIMKQFVLFQSQVILSTNRTTGILEAVRIIGCKSV